MLLYNTEFVKISKMKQFHLTINSKMLSRLQPELSIWPWPLVYRFVVSCAIAGMRTPRISQSWRYLPWWLALYRKSPTTLRQEIWKNNENVQLCNVLIMKLWKSCPDMEPLLSTGPVRGDKGSEGTTEGLRLLLMKNSTDTWRRGGGAGWWL